VTWPTAGSLIAAATSQSLCHGLCGPSPWHTCELVNPALELFQPSPPLRTDYELLPMAVALTVLLVLPGVAGDVAERHLLVQHRGALSDLRRRRAAPRGPARLSGAGVLTCGSDVHRGAAARRLPLCGPVLALRAGEEETDRNCGPGTSERRPVWSTSRRPPSGRRDGSRSAQARPSG